MYSPRQLFQANERIQFQIILMADESQFTVTLKKYLCV